MPSPFSAPLQSLTIPDLWQQQAVRHLREGRDVVVHAPTGAGKTFIFELFAPELRGQAVFTVPTRALANDKLAEWRKRGWEVGIATGDLAEGLDRKLLVATLETQRSRLLSGAGPKLLVIDEYQMIADAVRGIHYELSIALAPPETQLLLLSGSVANPQDIVAWLERIGRKATLISHPHRPVPLEEVDLRTLPDRAPSSVRGWWPRVIANALRQDLGPILIFAPRRQAAESLARQLAAALPPSAPLSLSPAQQQLAGSALAPLLRARVAFHHSGLSYAQRSAIVEPLAKAGHLRVVVATMGLAAGINFSMRSVAIASTTYKIGPFEHQVTPSELLQMYGRAGRRGLDETGYALVTPQPPRLADAHPLLLRRSAQLDWPTLLAVMHHAAARGLSPFLAAETLTKRLYSTQPVPLGFEHALLTGPTPCGLSVDSERARFLRRGTLQMLNSRNQWEPRPSSPQTLPLHQTWIRLSPPSPSPSADTAPRWVRAESSGTFMRTLIGANPFCRLSGPSKRLGREVRLGIRKEGFLRLAPWLQDALQLTQIHADELLPVVLSKLPALTDGGSPVELRPHGDQLFAKLSFENRPMQVWVDSFGRALLDPPTRRIVPPPCEACPQRDWCEETPILPNAAQAWRELGLIEKDGTPTRRGILFSFFQHGEGLAIAAALEDPSYPIDDLLFDLANLRGGPRFCEEEALLMGRLAMQCQQVYAHADWEGYLRFGVPSDYAAGASEAVRNLVLHGMGRHQLLTETLRMGDIERALLEWRSLLRHIAHASPHPWDRWESLQHAAKERLRAEEARMNTPPPTAL